MAEPSSSQSGLFEKVKRAYLSGGWAHTAILLIDDTMQGKIYDHVDGAGHVRNI